MMAAAKSRRTSPPSRLSVPLLRACEDPSLIPLSPHTGQQRFLELIGENRIVVGACGRRSGKSRAVAAAGLHNLLLVPQLDALTQPGETRYVLVVSNSREQSLILKEHARSLVHASPALRHELISEDEYELRFTNDRAFLAVPCNARSVRGYASSFVCFDDGPLRRSRPGRPASGAEIVVGADTLGSAVPGQ
jgi:hypothetical protein